MSRITELNSNLNINQNKNMDPKINEYVELLKNLNFIEKSEYIKNQSIGPYRLRELGIDCKSITLSGCEEQLRDKINLYRETTGSEKIETFIECDYSSQSGETYCNVSYLPERIYKNFKNEENKLKLKKEEELRMKREEELLKLKPEPYNAIIKTCGMAAFSFFLGAAAAAMSKK